MTPFPLRRGYADTSNGQLHYAEAGEGPPLLLVSESPRTHRQYRRLIPLLAPHFRVIAIDTPGYGDSDPPPQPPSIEGVTAQIAEALRALGLRRMHVFGLHTGNKIGSCLAADHAALVDKFVLVGHPHSIIPDQQARNAAIQPILDTYLPRYAAESADGAHLVRDWTYAQANTIGLWWPPKLLFGETVTPQDVEDAEDRVTDYLLGWRNTVAMYRAVFAYDMAAAWRRIDVPTLVIQLSIPQEAHFGDQAAQVAALIRDARSVCLDSAYLAGPQTHPQTLAREVLAFLR